MNDTFFKYSSQAKLEILGAITMTKKRPKPKDQSGKSTVPKQILMAAQLLIGWLMEAGKKGEVKSPEK